MMRAVIVLAASWFSTCHFVSGQFGGAWNTPNFGGYRGDQADYGRQFQGADQPRPLPLALPGVPLDANTPVDPFLGPLKSRQQQQIPSRGMMQTEKDNRRKDSKNDQQVQLSNNRDRQEGQQPRSDPQQAQMHDLDQFYKSLTGELMRNPNGMGFGGMQGGGPNY